MDGWITDTSEWVVTTLSVSSLLSPIVDALEAPAITFLSLRVPKKVHHPTKIKINKPGKDDKLEEKGKKGRGILRDYSSSSPPYQV